MTNNTEVGARRFRSVLGDRRGSASIEYALLACMIAIAGAVGLAPYSEALAQELSALSLDHLVAPRSADATQGCRRLEWSQAELSRFVPKAAANPN